MQHRSIGRSKVRSLKVNCFLGFIFCPLGLASQSAEANFMCQWMGRCFFESPGFRITVVDKETGKPLSDVHALSVWVQYGCHGTNGPLMVQDAVSGRAVFYRSLIGVRVEVLQRDLFSTWTQELAYSGQGISQC